MNSDRPDMTISQLRDLIKDQKGFAYMSQTKPSLDENSVLQQQGVNKEHAVFGKPTELYEDRFLV